MTESERPAESETPPSETSNVSVTPAVPTEALTPEARREDEAVVKRVSRLTRDAGWLLITAGIVGLVVPGVLGTPFPIMGAFALWPRTGKRLEHWLEGRPPKFFHGSMKQIKTLLGRRRAALPAAA